MQFNRDDKDQKDEEFNIKYNGLLDVLSAIGGIISIIKILASFTKAISTNWYVKNLAKHLLVGDRQILDHVYMLRKQTENTNSV